MTGSFPQIWLVRHGETAWTLSGQHTGRTDIPLTERGARQADALRGLVGGHKFIRELTSPLRRATETCRLAGLGEQGEISADLLEWDYGDYEGRTTAEV